MLRDRQADFGAPFFQERGDGGHRQGTDPAVLDGRILEMDNVRLEPKDFLADSGGVEPAPRVDPVVELIPPWPGAIDTRIGRGQYVHLVKARRGCKLGDQPDVTGDAAAYIGKAA